MNVDVILPDVGPARLSVWYADRGDTVFEGDRLVEVLIEGATIDVSAPATGCLLEKRAFDDDLLLPGQVLGIVQCSNESVTS